jgi:prevent-host-death family protein
MDLDVSSDMTEYGLVKTVTISYFKAHISEQLRKVRKGARIVISERETPVAEVVPFRSEPPALSVRVPLTAPFKPSRPSFRIDHDPLEYLLEDREKR